MIFSKGCKGQQVAERSQESYWGLKSEASQLERMKSIPLSEAAISLKAGGLGFRVWV